MFQEVKTYCNEILDILNELQSYENYKEKLNKDLSSLERNYEIGKYTYKQYIELKNRILGGRTKEAMMMYYNAYILTLLKRIDFLNAQIFSEVYGKEIIAQPLDEEAFEPEKIEVKLKTTKPKRKEKLVKVPFYVADSKEDKESKKEIALIPEKETAPKLSRFQFLKPKQKTEILERQNVQDFEQVKISEIPRPLPKRKIDIPEPEYSPFAFLGNKKRTLFDEIMEKEKVKEEQVKFRGIFNFELAKNIRKRLREKTKFIGDKTEISSSLLRLRKRSEEEIKIEKPTLMAEQAEKIRSILLKSKIKIYNPSSIGFIANITVRRIVLIFMNHFPDFFKQLYLNLRYANIKMLSNTYVNIMFFFTIITFLVSMPVSFILFSVQKMPFFINIAKSLLFSIILSSLCFAFFYMAPGFRIKKRIRSINTNLPFAIDHMASVAVSGVPPATMFKLIAQSKEYGEVSKEIEKISNYIEIFGYDLLSAIRSVSATTPNKQLKEFFDGLVSNIESGGDLKTYLSQMSKEALLTYRLERQKYVESISTYSDVYTGVLIAAPLFFVSTLTLVSMLGGSVGGFSVSTLIAVGTYIVIPVLNILFLIFLEMNQPQI